MGNNNKYFLWQVLNHIEEEKDLLGPKTYAAADLMSKLARYNSKYFEHSCVNSSILDMAMTIEEMYDFANWAGAECYKKYIERWFGKDTLQ